MIHGFQISSTPVNSWIQKMSVYRKNRTVSLDLINPRMFLDPNDQWSP